MLICTNCRSMYGSGAVVNVKSVPVDFTASEWTDLSKRKNNYMFLYGPEKPPFGEEKLPCQPTFTGRTCSLMDLQVHVVQQAPVLLPVQTAVIQTMAVTAVTHTNPVHIKPTWTFPNASAQIQNAISYADGTCQICKKDNQHTITESARSRWAAEQIHAYLGVLAVPSNPGFMVGVLVNEESRSVCVAYSTNSSTINAESHLSGCKFTGYSLNLYGNFGFADISKCRGGKDISKYRSLSMVNVGKDGQRSSETCAASKLAKQYMKKGTPLSKWNMTEIAYGTMTGYTDGVPAESCIGCQNFLPTLLCYESPDY